MPFPRWFVLPLLGALAFTPLTASAQGRAHAHMKPGKPVLVTGYSADAYGDWHKSYRSWRPVTLYAHDGQFYSRSMKGARAVQVYRHGNDYFLPPQDDAWVKRGDTRYNYRHRPNDDDYGRATAPSSHHD